MNDSMPSSTDGYFDVQVNGYGGVDFNSDDLTAESLHDICVLLRRHGVGQILATIITEQIDVMCSRITRLTTLIEADELAQDVIAGIHIEGPFLSPDPHYHGAHPAYAIRPAELDAASRLVDAGGGLVRLFTLAPEYDAGMKVIGWLRARDIVVSAGHTDASRENLLEAIDAGLTMFTHLGNGCPTVLPRHDNIIQRVLSLQGRLWCCFIADGVHIPWPALNNYLRLAGWDRVVITTDAMPAAGIGRGVYSFNGRHVRVGADLVAYAETGTGHLYGSTTTMEKSHQALREVLDLPNTVCQAILKDNPRKALNLYSRV